VLYIYSSFSPTNGRKNAIQYTTNLTKLNYSATVIVHKDVSILCDILQFNIINVIFIKDSNQFIRPDLLNPKSIGFNTCRRLLLCQVSSHSQQRFSFYRANTHTHTVHLPTHPPPHTWWQIDRSVRAAVRQVSNTWRATRHVAQHSTVVNSNAALIGQSATVSLSSCVYLTSSVGQDSRSTTTQARLNTF